MKLAAALLAGVLYGTVALAADIGDYALQKVLYDAKPIFGQYSNGKKSTATWMKRYPDSVAITQMNLPGVHDSDTGNYSGETRNRLFPIAQLYHGIVFPADYYRCQEKFLVEMLNDGIRVFDLRIAYDLTNSTLVFWHSQALQSQTATLEDVLFGFYHWLDQHPSEAVFLSLQHEGSTIPQASDSAAQQLELFRTLTTPAARHYFVQKKNELGTLGAARGKLTLFRRFDLDDLPQKYTDSLPGLSFSPSKWTDNSANITLEYNEVKKLYAYVEDYYQPDVSSSNAPASESINEKLNATEAHFRFAASSSKATKDSLFWTWCSATNVIEIPAVTPRIVALGDGTNDTAKGGVNQQLIPFFKSLKGKRLGIAMFDFYDTPSDLVQTFLDTQSPDNCH